MNSLETVVEWLEIRDNDNYHGLIVPKKIEEIKSTNKEYEGSKYSKFNSIKDKKGNVLKEPTKEQIKNKNFGSLEFILSSGFKIDEIEGSSRTEHLLLHKGVFKTFYEMYGRYPKKIAEIGFNAGISAYHFLSLLKKYNENDDYTMVSFDLGIHPYCFYAKYFIDKVHEGHHLLIDGSSDKSIPFFSKNFQYDFDIIFIDGDHSYYGALKDIINCKFISNRETIVIMDNCVPHRGVGYGVYLAYLKMYHQNYVKNLGFYEFENESSSYHDASSLYVYNFDGTNDNGEPIDYKYRERKMLDYSLARILQNKFLSKEKFEYVYKLVKDKSDEIDDFFINKFNKIYLPKYNKKYKLNYNEL